MMNLLFSPSGRINPSEFMKGATVLIVIGLVLALVQLVSAQLAMILGLVGLILYYCWIALWIKRYHDAGKSGWMCLIPIIVFIIVGMIFGMITSQMFVDPTYQAAVEEATASGDFGAIMQAAMSGGGGLTKTGILVNALGGAAIAYVIAMLFNNMIKREPNDNRFGPAS